MPIGPRGETIQSDVDVPPGRTGFGIALDDTSNNDGDALDAAARVMRQILAAIRDPVVCFDSRGGQIWCNRAYDDLKAICDDLPLVERRIAARAREIAVRNLATLADIVSRGYCHSSEFPLPPAGLSARAVFVPANERQAASVVIILAQRTERSVGQQVALLQNRHHLTPREREVMELLIRGLPNVEISKALGVSTHTARHHTESVLEKLGVRSRAAISALLRRS